MSKLRDASTQHLVNTENDPIEDSAEYYEFIATKILRSRFRMFTSQAFELMKDKAKKENFELMILDRYEAIMNCTGYLTTADELDGSKITYDTWSQEKRKFRSFTEFENIFFARSVENFSIRRMATSSGYSAHCFEIY